jgi:hypothetical protein
MMPKRQYVLAIACYLSIPVILIAGVGLFVVIDPELARGHVDYVGAYRLLELVRRGALAGTAVLAVLSWISCCYLVLKSRQRSLLWLCLAATGPFGFIVIGALEDRSPAASDIYQQFIRNLKIYWRVLLELAVFISIWVLAYEFVVLKRDLTIILEAFSTGTPTSSIVDQQNASGGMWAFGEWLEELYLVGLIYLLWPIFFNLAGRLLKFRFHAGENSRP